MTILRELRRYSIFWWAWGDVFCVGSLELRLYVNFLRFFHGEMHIRIWGRTSLQLRTWLMKISVKEDSSGVNLAGAPF